MPLTDRGAAILTVGHLGAETIKAGAQVYTATANLMATTVQSLAECSKAYFNYLEECQRTRQVEIWSYTVIAEARERTRRIELESKSLIRLAQEHTRQIEIQADITRQQLTNVQDTRESRMEIVRTFLDEHHKLNKLFMDHSGSRTQNLSVEERVQLAKYRDEILQRLRDLESAITSLAGLL